jgi:hypothetical protein
MPTSNNLPIAMEAYSDMDAEVWSSSDTDFSTFALPQYSNSSFNSLEPYTLAPNTGNNDGGINLKAVVNKKKRNGRKLSAVHVERGVCSTSSGKVQMNSNVLSRRPVENNMEVENKREKFLERNRAAASKCREKKKLWTHDLEEQARELTSQRHMVTQHVAILQNELLELKCKCLEHIHCECEQIRDYLQNTVAQLNPVHSSFYKLFDPRMPLVSSASPPVPSHESTSVIHSPGRDQFQLSSSESDANSTSYSGKPDGEVRIQLEKLLYASKTDSYTSQPFSSIDSKGT